MPRIIPDQDWGDCATPEQAVKHVGDGWTPLVLKAFALLDESGLDYSVVQVKEKFGGLRFYFDFIGKATPEQVQQRRVLHDQIGHLEAASQHTCENCGKPGEPFLRGGTWWKTCCEDCQTREAWGMTPQDGWAGEPRRKDGEEAVGGSGS